MFTLSKALFISRKDFYWTPRSKVQSPFSLFFLTPLRASFWFMERIFKVNFQTFMIFSIEIEEFRGGSNFIFGLFRDALFGNPIMCYGNLASPLLIFRFYEQHVRLTILIFTYLSLSLPLFSNLRSKFMMAIRFFLNGPTLWTLNALTCFIQHFSWISFCFKINPTVIQDKPKKAAILYQRLIGYYTYYHFASFFILNCPSIPLLTIGQPQYLQISTPYLHIYS